MFAGRGAKAPGLVNVVRKEARGVGDGIRTHDLQGHNLVP